MRVFYVFKINEHFSYTYENRAYKMFKILDDIYNTREYDLELSFMYYEQILDYFNVELINKYLYNNLSICKDYYKKTNIHIISDNHEYTKLIVTKDCIRIKTNQDFPNILNHLAKHTKNTFVCDFLNKEYFWLKNEKEIVDKNKILC